MSLPFELKDKHKNVTKQNWKQTGLIMDNFEDIYQKYIHTTNCELCNKEFLKSNDRQMEHNHETGEFRNIVCSSCNMLKHDVKLKSSNSSGYSGISKVNDTRFKQGYTWVFEIMLNGKKKFIKKSVDLDKLITYATQWKIDNSYHK